MILSNDCCMIGFEAMFHDSLRQWYPTIQAEALGEGQLERLCLYGRSSLACGSIRQQCIRSVLGVRCFGMSEWSPRGWAGFGVGGSGPMVDAQRTLKVWAGPGVGGSGPHGGLTMVAQWSLNGRSMDATMDATMVASKTQGFTVFMRKKKLKRFKGIKCSFSCEHHKTMHFTSDHCSAH